MSVLALASSADASAGGGDYVFDGGSAAARAQVRAALEASGFPWDIVPIEVTIHIGDGHTPSAEPGEIWLDRRLLLSGRFAWGIVQHEYAHQVAFFLFDRRQRTELTRLLGAKTFCYERPPFDHADQACERFAATLAWSYWPSRDNTERPASPADESAAMAPGTFRSLMARMLGDRSLARASA